MRQLCGYLVFGILLVNISTTCLSSNSDQSYNSNSIDRGRLHESPDNDWINISQEGQQAAGIKTEVLQLKSTPTYISLMGEVTANQDLTAIVTPRVRSQIVRRLINTGEHVKEGQPLALLSSVVMANAQSELMVAYKEWLRAKQLKQKVIAAKYYHIAEVTYQQKYSKLLSYGMTQVQIKVFLKSNDPGKADGSYTLLAPRSGTIFTSDFVKGQIINSGKVLYKIVDEKNLWIDAMLSSGDFGEIKKGDKAFIKTAHHELAAYVLQVHHKLDETTRTRVIRLSVSNSNDQLHAGEFVSCLIKTGQLSPGLAVDKTALMRTADGDMVIYIEVKPNYYKPQHVQVIKRVGPWRIIRGVKPGVRIVTKGAFFVHAEALKGGFTKHNH